MTGTEDKKLFTWQYILSCFAAYIQLDGRNV